MNSSNDDLEDYVEKFRNIFYKQEEYNINKSDTWSLIDNLTKELELSKEREDCLQNCLAKYVENENVDITTKYVSLRETCEAFEKENVDLKRRLDDLQVQMTMSVESLKSEYLRQLSELEEKYKCEISKLKEQNDRDRICYEEKEKKLYDELQLAQATTALQCDEIESNLKRQLVDSYTKLRNSQNVIRNLHMDINNLKTQLASQQTQSYHKPPKPEIKFQPLPINTRIANQSTHLINFEDPEPEDAEFFEAPSVRNTTPMDRATTPLNRNNTEQTSTPLVFRGSNNKAPTKMMEHQASRTKKKRRLYDPDNFDTSNLPMF